jgi:hypothetical protein
VSVIPSKWTELKSIAKPSDQLETRHGERRGRNTDNE